MRTPFLCRLGLHRMVQTEQLITMGRCRCIKCGEEWITSLFGDFPTEDAAPFAWVDNLEWHQPAHRAVMASVKLGAWMSAALDDPKVCEAMKADINEWFAAGEPMEILGQAFESARAAIARTSGMGEGA